MCENTGPTNMNSVVRPGMVIGVKVEDTGRECIACGGKIKRITTEVTTSKTHYVLGGPGASPVTEKKVTVRCEKCHILYDL